MRTKSTYNLLFFPLIGVLIFLGTSCLNSDSGDVFDPVAQFSKDTLAIDNFLASKGITAQVDSASRIRYIIVDEGTGDHPKSTDSVVFNYVGRLIPNETKFGEGDSITYKLNELIPGWQICLPLIKEGGSIHLFLPSYYAYGSRGSANGAIPPNTPIWFDTDLIEVK